MAVKVAGVAGMSGKLHRHGCRGCKQRYDDSCTTPEVDILCTECRRPGSGWELLRDNALPRDCCVAHSRPITKAERESFKLAGACSWVICPVCARTHPFDPRRDVS